MRHYYSIFRFQWAGPLIPFPTQKYIKSHIRIHRICRILHIFIIASSFFLSGISKTFGQKEPDTVKIFHHLRLAKNYLDNNILDSVEYHAKEALMDLPAPGLKHEELRAHIYLGSVYERKRQSRLSYREFNICKKLIGSNKKAENIFSIYVGLGNACMYLTKYPEAAENYFALLKLAKSANDTFYIMASYGNIGNLYAIQKEYELALKYQEKALKMGKVLKDTFAIAETLGNIGNIYIFLEEYNAALQYLNKSLALRKIALSKLSNPGKDSLRVLISISNNYSNIGVVYERQNKVDSARINYEESLRLVESIGYGIGIATSNHNLGTLLKMEGKYKRAKPYLEIAVEVNDENLDLLAESYKELSYVYEGLELYKKAFDNYKIYHELKDSILNGDIRSQTLIMDILEKEEENARQETTRLMQEQEIERQQARSNRIKFIAIVLFAFLSLALFFIFGLQRSKKHREDILDDLKHATIGTLPKHANQLEKAGETVTDLQQSQKLLTHLAYQTRAAASIYDILYANYKSNRTIAIDVFIGELVNKQKARWPIKKEVHMSMAIEPKTIPLKDATTHGLILNEFMTNSFKYAFPGDKQPEFTIKLFSEGKKTTFYLRDNGVGYPEPIRQLTNSDSQGIGLMYSHAKRLRGKAKFYNHPDGGAVCEITGIRYRKVLQWL